MLAGGGPYQGNILWDATRLCADFAYRTLEYQGYEKENIRYLSDDDSVDSDGNGIVDDVFASPPGVPPGFPCSTCPVPLCPAASSFILYFRKICSTKYWITTRRGRPIA